MDPMTNLIGLALAGVSGPTYIAGRSWAKGKAQVAVEQGKAVQAAAKLQEAIGKK